MEYLGVKFARYKDFDSFLHALEPEEQRICIRLRELILSHFPEMQETWAYGAPFYKGKRRICFLYPASLPYSGLGKGVNLGFNRGHMLSNAQGLLQMEERKVVAYVPFLFERDIDEAVLLEILHEAVLIDQV